MTLEIKIEVPDHVSYNELEQALADSGIVLRSLYDTKTGEYLTFSSLVARRQKEKQTQTKK